MSVEVPPRLTPPQPVPETPSVGPRGSRRWRRARRLVARAHLTGRRILGVLGLGMMLASLYHFYWPLVAGPPAPAPMTGDINVAVAELLPAAGTDASFARALSDSLHRAVRDDLRALRPRDLPIDLQVAGPTRVGEVGGDGPAQRLAAAGRRAGELDAHVLLYGVVKATEQEVELRPQFAFADPVRHPEDRGPLLTAIQVPPGPSPGQSVGVIREAGGASAGPAIRARVRRRVAGRARALASFVLGLSLYSTAVEQGGAAPRRSASGLDEAARWFRAAQRAGWDPRVGHVLHLMLGNVALLRGRMGAAARHYAHALRSRSDFSRAQLGLAEVRFHDARAECGRERARAALGEAVRRYRSVLAGTGGRTSALQAKAQFGLGRAALCRADWRSAEGAFRAVVSLYNAGRRDVRPQAGGALGGLGLVVLLRGDAAPAQLRAAARHFARAIALTPRGSRQGALWSFLGNARAQLGEERAARQAYRRAMALDPARRAAYRGELKELLRP